ncbi:restriction endonuclease subunit S [Bacillus cereus]|nr:restriction endonuclease subunit S [Bacillus cereus]
MPKIYDLFDIHNGITTSNYTIHSIKDNGMIPMYRPSQKINNTIAGYIYETDIPSAKIFEDETIFVSTNGQGSHTYAYVSSEKFTANSDVAILIPKKNMSLLEKLFYANCITQNRWLFSYGRKPKGYRLGNIELPNELPDWLNKVTAPDYNQVKESKLKEAIPPLNTKKWKEFSYEELFDIEVGKGKTIKKCQENKGNTPVVTASLKNNGIGCYTSFKPTHKGNVLTLIATGQGGVGYAFYQPKPFCGQNILVMNPKFSLNEFIGIFLVTLIAQEKYRFSYGRVCNLERAKKTTIKLPVNNDGNPDWNFMEKYIKTLKYSNII